MVQRSCDVIGGAAALSQQLFLLPARMEHLIARSLRSRQVKDFHISLITAAATLTHRTPIKVRSKLGHVRAINR